MLEALKAFSDADFYLAENQVVDLGNFRKITRKRIQKAKEEHLVGIERSIQVLKQDMAVRTRFFDNVPDIDSCPVSSEQSL